MNTSFISDMLPFILRPDNVARYEEGKVFIANRKKYPFEETMECYTEVEDVARAIENMVTQGGGQWISSAYAMAIAARKAQGKSQEETYDLLDKARIRLSNTRPTNTTLARRLSVIMDIVKKAMNSCVPVENAILDWTRKVRDKDYENFANMGRIGADLINDGDGILTMCFAEMSFIFALAFAKSDGKDINAFTPETRPYLQGARLTAPCIHELGIQVKIISDNMPAFLFSRGKIHKYFTAADLVTLDGYVVNKIGTFQNAICAKYHKVPYFVFCSEPDTKKEHYSSIIIEERDPNEIKYFQGMPTTLPEIDAYYPAFDITPPHLVTGIITKNGLQNPYALKMVEKQ